MNSVRYLFLIALAAAFAPAQQAIAQETAPPATAPNPSAQPGPVASTDGETPGMRVEVTELKRSGSVVTLKFTIVNESSDEFNFGYDLGDPSMSTIDFNSIGGIHLIDNEGKKKYMVVRDASNKCVCSSGLKALAPQARMALWARFPAPPADVETVSVIIPHFIPMDGVPLSQ
ncbi:MAG TPA: hypothetical protein VF200_08380 [Woeseiaceae bacterium]